MTTIIIKYRTEEVLFVLLHEDVYLIRKKSDLQAVDSGTWLVVSSHLISLYDQIINGGVAGEPTAINRMDSACLPNLLLVLYFLNEDVGKGKPSP